MQNPFDYSIEGLYYPLGGAKNDPERCPYLCYLVGLVTSPAHGISDLLAAKKILSYLYESEEQVPDSDGLKEVEKFFDRYFSGGYHPQTPCMVVRNWSPIAALLECGMKPTVLARESKFRAVASGIWQPAAGKNAMSISLANTDEDLFWAIFTEVSHRAIEQKMWISVIAKPGWDYSAAIGSLPDWSHGEIEKAGRVLWKRTPEG